MWKGENKNGPSVLGGIAQRTSGKKALSKQRIKI